MKDKEIERIQNALSLKKPSEDQMQRWKSKLKAEPAIVRGSWWSHLFAAGVGFACATVIFISTQNREIVNEDFNFESATSESIYDK